MDGVRVSVKNPELERMLVSYQAFSNKHLAPPSKVLLGREEIEDYTKHRRMSQGEDEMKKYAYTPTTTQNEKCELITTELEGKSIAGFNIGGEMRLCLIQIIKKILMEFKLSEINPIFDELKVYCALCEEKQLKSLKEKNIIPDDTQKCGLITKSDAQRLCSFLKNTLPGHHLDDQDDSIKLLYKKKKAYLASQTKENFRVSHSCFGGCHGVFIESQNCIRCDKCHHLFSPESFVSHVHSFLENKQTCHWGFDSSNWSHYLVVDPSEPEEKEAMLNAIKERHFKQLTQQNSLTLPFPPPINIKDLPFCNHDDKAYDYDVPPVIVNDTRQHSITTTILEDFPPNISLVPDHHHPLPWQTQGGHDNDDGAFHFPRSTFHSFNGVSRYEDLEEVKSDDDDDEEEYCDGDDDGDEDEEDEVEYERIAGVVEELRIGGEVGAVVDRLQRLCRGLMAKNKKKNRLLLEKRNVSKHPPNKTLPFNQNSLSFTHPFSLSHHNSPFHTHHTSHTHLHFESSSSTLSEHTSTKSDTPHFVPKKRKRSSTLNNT